MDNSIFKKIKAYCIWAKKLWHPFRKTAYLMGTPTHDNIGDIAIAVAEVKFLQQCGYTKVVNLTIAECWESYGCIAKLLPRKAPVFLHGGGNMGDIYNDEQLRRTILPSLEGHAIIVFPQSIYYTDTERGTKEEALSIRYYNNNMVTIFAREQKSYEIMRSLYKNANVLFVPDIVLSLKAIDFKEPRSGIQLCFRDDQEKLMSDEKIKELARRLHQKGYKTRYTSMIYPRQIPVSDWENVVREKMKQIGTAKLLITDRLHGMVFSALTQTPCIVFGNNHHKVIGVYQWISHLNYIRFAESVEEACKFADELYRMQDCRFVFDDEAFDALRTLIRDKQH